MPEPKHPFLCIQEANPIYALRQRRYTLKSRNIFPRLNLQIIRYIASTQVMNLEEAEDLFLEDIEKNTPLDIIDFDTYRNFDYVNRGYRNPDGLDHYRAFGCTLGAKSSRVACQCRRGAATVIITSPEVENVINQLNPERYSRNHNPEQNGSWTNMGIFEPNGRNINVWVSEKSLPDRLIMMYKNRQNEIDGPGYYAKINDYQSYYFKIPEEENTFSWKSFVYQMKLTNFL